MQPFLQWNSVRCSEGVRSQYQTWLRRSLHNYRARNCRRLDLRTRVRLEYRSCDPTRHQVRLALLQYFDLLQYCNYLSEAYLVLDPSVLNLGATNYLLVQYFCLLYFHYKLGHGFLKTLFSFKP